MAHILQRAFHENQKFEEIIESQKSLVVFVRHPG